MHVPRGGSQRLLDAVAGDARAVGRPRWIRVRPDLVRDAAGRAAVHRDDPDVRHGVALALGRPIRDEGDVRAVGRPGRLGVVPVAIGQSARLAVRDADGPEVLAPRGPEESFVRLVAHAVVRADAFTLPAFLAAILHHEGDAR